MRRILISLGLTVLGLIVTWIFLRPREWKTDSVSSKQSVAYVVELSNDVSRQEEGRLLWSPIRKGDKIFAGDKIKTSGLSSTKIQFADSKSKLDIEENSIVLISIDKNKFSLNMLEGRVFVQGDEGKNSLNLLSAGKKIDYAGDTAISVNESGESQVESFGQGSLFRDLHPLYSQTLLSAKNEVELAWKADPRSSNVDVYVGESPLLLKKVEKDPVPFADGKISAAMKPGVNYWQLSTNEQGKEVKSPLMKVVLNRPLPPTQIFPLHKEVVTASERPFDFKWNKGSSAGVTSLVVAKDNEFRNVVLKEEVKDQTFFTPAQTLPEGDYVWRLSFNLPSGEMVQSPVASFTIHRGGGLLSPVLLEPMDREKFYLGAGGNTEIRFEWKRQENVTYALKISGDNFEKQLESASNSTKVMMGKPGIYKWEVTSRTPDGKISILPSQKSFEVKSEGKIPWITGQKLHTYLENLPVVILRWQKTYAGAAVLKVSSTPDFREAESFNVPGKDFPFRPSADGVYYAQVQGLDENGTISATSEITDFEIKLAPVPPAPVSQSKKIMANSTGDFAVSMTNQKTSWLLIAQLVDQKGGVLDERRFSDNSIKFSGLLPGRYMVRTHFQDEYNRKGETGVIELEVPQKSRIPAPKLKGIKVR